MSASQIEKNFRIYGWQDYGTRRVHLVSDPLMPGTKCKVVKPCLNLFEDNKKKERKVGQRKNGKLVVPAFSIQLNQAGTICDTPVLTTDFLPRGVRFSKFRSYYNRGDFPLCIRHASSSNKIVWSQDLSTIDYHHYLPQFFQGLIEIDHPYAFLSCRGSHDLIEHGGERALSCLPQLIMPLKAAMNTRHPKVILNVLGVIRHMILACEMIGEALIPYYRQLLPIFNLYINKNLNIDDQIDYGQRHCDILGDEILSTLHLMERFGGEDAFINIKYLIPTYESIVLN